MDVRDQQAVYLHSRQFICTVGGTIIQFHDYLREQFGVTWKKSACVYCPFNRLTTEAIERHKAHPAQVADALMYPTREEFFVAAPALVAAKVRYSMQWFDQQWESPPLARKHSLQTLTI
jgi:hypothetical protein